MKTRWIVTIICFGFATIMAGCSSTLLTNDEKEYNAAEMYYDWQQCRAIVEQSKSFWVSRFESTAAIRRGLKQPPTDVMRRDLMDNRCHARLGKTG